MVMEALTNIGYSIIGLAVLVGIGIFLVGSFGSSVANCATGYTYQANGSGTTYTTGLCCLNTGNCASAGNYTQPSTATQNLNTMNTYLGTSGGGLASWIPLVIILTVGLFFLGAFMVKKGRSA